MAQNYREMSDEEIQTAARSIMNRLKDKGSIDEAKTAIRQAIVNELGYPADSKDGISLAISQCMKMAMGTLWGPRGSISF